MMDSNSFAEWGGRRPEGDVRSLVVRLRAGTRSVRLVIRVRLEHQIANAVLRRRVGDRPQQRKAATFTVDGVLPRGERNVATGTATPLPDGEPDQLQALECA